MITIKDLIYGLEDFSKIHKKINSFSYGFEDKIVTKDIIYPHMYVKIDRNQSIGAQSTYKLSISLLDLSKTDDSNSLDIVSNMEMVGNDIVSYFLDGEIFYSNERNINSNPLFNVTDDNCDGYMFEIEFINRKNLNKCILPIINPLTASSIETSPIICHGGTGEVLVSAQNGVPPYTGTGTFTQTAVETTYIVTDSRGATTTTSISLSEPDELEVEIDTIGVDDRIKEPYLTELTLNVSGGTSPYTLNSDLSFQYNGDIIGISNHLTSIGEAEILNDNEFTFKNVVSYNANYPYFNINVPNAFIVGENYNISFDYEVLEGPLDFNIYITSGVWNSNHLLYVDSVSGTHKYNKTIPVGATGLGNITFRINSDFTTTRKIKISNLKIYKPDEMFDIEMKSDSIELVQGLNTTDYTITDSVGCSPVSISNTFEVQTPNSNMIISVDDRNDFSGNNSALWIQTYSKDAYINWGDGTLEQINTGSLTMYTHNYDTQPAEYNIDIYGVGMDSPETNVYNTMLIRIYGGSLFWIKPHYFNTFEINNSPRIQFYHATMNGSFDMIDEGRGPNQFYGWYNTNMAGNLEKLRYGGYFYNLSQQAAFSVGDSLHSNGIYGDIGTFLKGLYRIDIGMNYTNALYTWGGNHTYVDRIDASFNLKTYIYVRGRYNNSRYWAFQTSEESAYLIIDIDMYLDNPNGKTININNNPSPNLVSEPLLSEFNAAKANLIANGCVVTHS